LGTAESPGEWRTKICPRVAVVASPQTREGEAVCGPGSGGVSGTTL